MEAKDMPKCDVCGKPATNLARDVIRSANKDTGWYEYKPKGTLKAGCERHPVRSETFEDNP